VEVGLNLDMQIQ